MLKGVHLLLLGALAVPVRTIINDWSTPCFGSCAYDISNSHLEAGFYISGDDTAVSDLTPAAGWTILDCAANGRAQDIRAVCNSTDVDSPCNHLFQGGAVGTIVRLPEDCTQMQFARIAAVASEHTLDKRDADVSSPIVQVFSVDADFGASSHGEVSFWVQTAGMPLPESLGLVPRLDFSRDYNKTGNGTIVSGNVYAPIFNQSIDCPQSGDRPDLSESVLIGIDFSTSTSLNYGVVIVGSLNASAGITLTNFSLYAALEGYIDGTLIVNTTAGASIDSGQIPIFSRLIGEGINIDSIVTIGPMFTLNVEGTASVDVGLNMAAGINYTFNNASMYYPSQGNTPGDLFQPGSTEVNLDGAADITVNTTLAAHMIPTITFGIAVGKPGDHFFTNVGIDLALDAFLNLSLDLEESASISVANTTGSKSKAENSAFNGSVAVQGGLDVSVGANASFFDLFDVGVDDSVYQKTVTLYQDNFGDSGPSKRDLILAPHRSLAQRSNTVGNNSLKCSSN